MLIKKSSTTNRRTSEYQELCPNCGNNLKNHNNEQLQQCAFNELSKINRKSTPFDLEPKSQSNGNPISGGSCVG